LFQDVLKRCAEGASSKEVGFARLSLTRQGQAFELGDYIWIKHYFWDRLF
jgi:hypothetical protein